MSENARRERGMDKALKRVKRPRLYFSPEFKADPDRRNLEDTSRSEAGNSRIR